MRKFWFLLPEVLLVTSNLVFGFLYLKGFLDFRYIIGFLGVLTFISFSIFYLDIKNKEKKKEEEDDEYYNQLLEIVEELNSEAEIVNEKFQALQKKQERDFLLLQQEIIVEIPANTQSSSPVRK